MLHLDDIFKIFLVFGWSMVDLHFLGMTSVYAIDTFFLRFRSEGLSLTLGAFDPITRRAVVTLHPIMKGNNGNVIEQINNFLI